MYIDLGKSKEVVEEERKRERKDRRFVTIWRRGSARLPLSPPNEGRIFRFALLSHKHTQNMPCAKTYATWKVLGIVRNQSSEYLGQPVGKAEARLSVEHVQVKAPTGVVFAQPLLFVVATLSLSFRHSSLVHPHHPVTSI